MSKGFSGRIPDLVVQDLVSRTDLGALIGEFVQLKRAGQNLSGLCPFHEEKTPSFTVSPIKNFYYCFGCAANGNAIRFLMDYQHLSFVAACENLAQRLGIKIQYEAGQAPTPKPVTDHLNTALDCAKLFYRQELEKLPPHHPVQQYLKQRNITQPSMQKFEIGYAPSGWEALKQHLQRHGIPETDSLESGLLTLGKNGKIYDRFRARVMFPIKDIKGKTIAFGGRVLNDEQPKYLNSPESPIFQKRQALFGLNEVIKAGKIEKILISEGYLDVIRMHQVGLHYGVAALGTATSETHIRNLFRLSDQIIACFDSDRAGEKAAWRFLEHALPLLQSHQGIDFLFLPQGEDPDSFIDKFGKDAFKVEELKAKGLSVFFIDKLTADLDLEHLDDRAKLLKRALPLVQQIQKSFLRELLLNQLSQISQLSVERLEAAAANTSHTIEKKSNTENRSNSQEQQQTHYSQRHSPQQSNGQHKSQSQNWEQKPWQPQSSKNQSRPQQSWKKTWQKREPEPTAPLPKFQSLVDSMLRLLLQQPELAQHKPLTLEATPPLKGFDIFEATYQQLRENPEASLAYLMGFWHDQPQGQHLAQLAAAEFLVPNESGHLEFADGLDQLEHLALNQALTQTAKTKPLDKERLQQLLEKKRQREAEKAALAAAHKT